MDTIQEKTKDKTHKILIVDDEEDELEALFQTLNRIKDFKTDISMAENAEAALAEMEIQDFDLILSDFRMPAMDGVEFLKKVRDKYPNIVRMLITGWADLEIAKKAINKAEVHDLIEKPWYTDELRDTILRALKQKSETESVDSIRVASFNDALKVLYETQEKVSLDMMNPEYKQKVVLEFLSELDFRSFINRIKLMDNVKINDMHVFNNIYLVEFEIEKI